MAKGAKKGSGKKGSSGRKPGGQPKHKGKTLEQTDHPDKIVRCAPETCACCGESLESTEGITTSKRQVVDIPPIRPEVTEYQEIQKQCSCGQIAKGVYPDDVNAPVQLGKRIQSFPIYLNTAQLVPYQRLKNMFKDLFGLSISKASLEKFLKQGAQAAKSLESSMKTILKSEKYVGSDETGCRVAGKRWWQWTWQSPSISFYTIHARRAYEVIKTCFGEDYSGILIHDCYSAQNKTFAEAGHQLCHAHLIRDLQFLIEIDQNLWAYRMKYLLLAAQRARDHIWQVSFAPALRQIILNAYQKHLSDLNAWPDSNNQNVLRLQKRFRKHSDSILRFMAYPDIPSDNNSSERAIRMAKVKQKISGCFRSVSGAQTYAWLLGIIETAKKQNKNILEAIEQLLDGKLQFQKIGK